MSSKSQIKKNAYFALEQVNKIFPEAQTDLKNWSTSFQFLVCIILSAQATDKQVNKVTQKLFEIVPDPKAFIEFTGGSTENTMSSIYFFKVNLGLKLEQVLFLSL